ncbi:MAG: HEAT repeat domain-containing protein [Candidatus Riflebacteria bacterium]|nr:HEAT repeat domain-containing protein [Candidatus Riflebacteria bacterium]
MLKPIELVDLLEQYERFLVQYAVGVFRRIGDTYPAIESRLLGIIKGSVFPVPLDVFTRHLERLSDPDLVRRKAAEAVLERYHLHREILEFIESGTTPELAREPLAEVVEKGEPSQRALALVTLATMGQDKARESLLAEFEGLPRPLRWGILILLESRHDVEWLPLFQANLEDAEPDVARIAITAVGKTGTASASAKLQGLLSHGSEMIVIAAIQTLAQIRDPGAVPALKDLARSTTSAKIRATVMSAFGDFQDATTIGPLLEALDNDDPRTRANAILALKRRFLSQGNPDPVAIDRIKALLKDGDHRVRADAAQALWELGHQDSLPVIGGMLKSPAEADRTSGAYLCGKLRLSQFSDQLAALTDDRSWNVRKTASIALLGLGPSGLLLLQTLMSHGTPDQQVCAAYAAGLADDPGAVDSLLAQSRSGSEMGEMATDLLLRLSKPAETRPEPEPDR